MIRGAFNKLKNFLWPQKVRAAKVQLTNGAIIEGQSVKITIHGAGGGGGRLVSPPNDKSSAAPGEKE